MTSDGHRQGPPAVSGPGDQERRVAAVLDRREHFADTAAFLTALLALLAPEPHLEDGSIARIALALDGEDIPPILRFWADLSTHFPDHALLAACHGNALLRDARDPQAMDRIATALALDPQVVLELDDAARALARDMGGLLWLRFQLAELRVLLADIEHAAAGADGDPADQDGALEDAEEMGEEVRERYSELLDEHGNDPDALAQIREVGAIISHLERDGLLPQCMILRGGSRR